MLSPFLQHSDTRQISHLNLAFS